MCAWQNNPIDLEYLAMLKILTTLKKKFLSKNKQLRHTMHSWQTVCSQIAQKYSDKLKIKTALGKNFPSRHEA